MDPAMRSTAEDGIAVSRRLSFVEMLEAVEGDVGGLFAMDPSLEFAPPPPPATSLCTPSYGTMLCFGGGGNKKTVGDEKTPTATTSSTSSSSSSSGLSKHKSKEGSPGNAPKKQRKGGKQSNGGCNGGEAGKVRKERIGDRIVALQQLVSPFGKSDTASVLHEALGYIKFLHDQVQVLSTPYLQQLPPSACFHGSRSDLRSRGLCLMPLSSTAQLAGSNGADLWSAVTKH